MNPWLTALVMILFLLGLFLILLVVQRKSNGTLNSAAMPHDGNVYMVDPVNGDDALAARNAFPFATVNAAVTAATIDMQMLPNQVYTICCVSGVHLLSSGIILPNGISMIGMGRNTILMLSDASSTVPFSTVQPTTMVTMGDTCTIERLQLFLTTEFHFPLVGVSFPTGSVQTSQLNDVIVTVTNATAPTGGSSNVTGISCVGTNTSFASVSSSYSFLVNSSVYIYSTGGGTKRALVGSSGFQPMVVGIRNSVLFVSEPNQLMTSPASHSSGNSYICIQATDANTHIILRGSTISGPVSNTNGVYAGVAAGDASILSNQNTVTLFSTDTGNW